MFSFLFRIHFQFRENRKTTVLAGTSDEMFCSILYLALKEENVPRTFNGFSLPLLFFSSFSPFPPPFFSFSLLLLLSSLSLFFFLLLLPFFFLFFICSSSSSFSFSFLLLFPSHSLFFVFFLLHGEHCERGKNTGERAMVRGDSTFCFVSSGGCNVPRFSIFHK